MEIVEQYRNGEINFQEAGRICREHMNKYLHWASSYTGANRREVRAKHYFDAYQWKEEWLQCYEIMVERCTPHPLDPLPNGWRLQFCIGANIGYVPPEKFDESKILHRPMSSRERLARESETFARLDNIIYELESRGYGKAHS